jgi:hypothetical protein
MVSPLLHVGLLWQGGKGKAAPRKSRAGAQGQMTGRGLADLYRKPKHPTAKNKLFIRDPSDL